MPTTFTDLPAAKTGNRFPVTDTARQVAYTDFNGLRTTIGEVTAYLEAGIFDASASSTFATAAITTAAIGTATIAQVNATHVDAIADQSPLVGPEMDWKGFAARWFIGVDVANSPTSRDFVLTGLRLSYSFPDGVTTSGSPTLTSAAGGGFTSALVGSSISGSGIPVGATIIAVGGPTSLTLSANATLTASNVIVTITRAGVTDLAYWKHRGALSPTLGLGVTPPDGSARVQISPSDDEPAMGTVRLRKGPTQTGKVLTLHDSAPTDMWWVDSSFYMTGAHSVGGAIAIKAPNDATGRALLLAPFDLTTHFSLDFPSGSGNVLRVRNATNNQSVFECGTNGSFRHLSTNLGFFGANVTTKPSIAGSRGGNAALADLLTKLALLGLVTDGTTA